MAGMSVDLVLGTSSLVMSSVRTADAGQYICIANITSLHFDVTGTYTANGTMLLKIQCEFSTLSVGVHKFHPVLYTSLHFAIPGNTQNVNT